MKRTGEVSYDEPFMMSAFIKEDAKHIFDSEWNFVGIGASRFNRAMRNKGLERWQFAHMKLEHLILAGPNNNFCAFVGGQVEGQPYVGRAKLEISTPSLGDEEVFIPKIWELGNFCVGMAFDNLLAEVDDPTDQSNAPQATHDIIKLLVYRGFNMVRGGGSVRSTGSPPTDIGLVEAARQPRRG
jgi:hypothetical protein